MNKKSDVLNGARRNLTSKIHFFIASLITAATLNQLITQSNKGGRIYFFPHSLFF